MAKISPTLIGKIAYYGAALIRSTLRLKVKYHPNTVPHKQYIFCFWHDKQFTPAMYFDRLGQTKQAAFVSASRDGDMLAAWLKMLKYDVVRGSSNRKAISGMVHMIKKAKQGYTIGIAADGPRGPCYQAKPGAAYVAQKSGVELVPLGVAYSRKWIFSKAWDKYQLPKFFSKVAFYFGEPITITPEFLNDNVEAKLTQLINDAEKQASQML